MPHDELSPKVQKARQEYHEALKDRFLGTSKTTPAIKEFLFIAALLDPRYKKLRFDGDDYLDGTTLRDDAVRYLRLKYNADYKGKVRTSGGTSGGATPAAAATTPATQNKREKVSSKSIFKKRVPSRRPPPPRRRRRRRGRWTTSSPSTTSSTSSTSRRRTSGRRSSGGRRGSRSSPTSRAWRGSTRCPATSATVERLFSKVGLDFSDKKKSSSAETLADRAFTKINVKWGRSHCLAVRWYFPLGSVIRCATTLTTVGSLNNNRTTVGPANVEQQ